ncbi:MAG TPA: B12-binding domain-containing radical SAM protein, partial [Desulfotomaculum sp.]|nr:B12-binding domain-containing radical SAM protein [Desulfotomaculum sp.]
MKVILIYPEFPDTFWSFKYALKFTRKKACFPPLGLLTVAAMLPQEWQKRLVDLNVRGLTNEDLSWADCAFVSAMTIQRASAREAIARCKEAGLKIVAGGPLFATEWEEFPEVDHFLLREAELTLPLFLQDLAQGRAKRIYDTDEFADMSTSPVPQWDLADLRAYATMSIQYSRGCPHNCEFCNVTALFGRRMRTKSAIQVLAELETLYCLGWRGGGF